jgi:hypothetical protein
MPFLTRHACAWRAAVTVGVAALAACGMGAPATTRKADPAQFEAARAWKHLEGLVAIGPRDAGTPGAESARQFIEKELKAAGCEPVREAFKAQTPAGELEMVNVYADLLGRAKDEKPAHRIVIGSHYDTKRKPYPFVGANDSGSSTAVLLELARVLRTMEPGPYTYRVLFLDGEEAVREEWADPDNRYGSRYHAEQLKKSGEAANTAAFVLLDMVGDKDLRLERDSYSDKELQGIFFDAARALKLEKHVATGAAQAIRDDHHSFLAIGVPAVDLIDLDYGPSNAYWHTAEDTLDKCSQASLEVIGRITLAGLPALEANLAKRGR